MDSDCRETSAGSLKIGLKLFDDARGNLIQENRGKDGKLVTTFEYNLNNQLIKTTKDGQTTTYTYDPLGRRISKTDTFGTPATCGPATKWCRNNATP